MEGESGIVETCVNAPFETVRQRLEQAIADAGMTLFARIDHAGGARAAGMEMPPTQVLIFGNARGGTPVMLTAPLAALDLPLRVLLREVKTGQTGVAYRPAAEMLAGLGVLPELVEGLQRAMLRVVGAAG